MNDSSGEMSDAEKVDRLCDEFEAAFREGKSPKIEDYLDREPRLRAALLAELMRLEIDLFQEQGRTLSFDEYRARFPDALELIDKLAGTVPEAIVVTPRPDDDDVPEQEAAKDRRFPQDFGDYRLLGEIGAGGMGIVYEAEQTTLGNRRVAIKTIKHAYSVDEHALKRFKTEVQAVAQLEHRHIVPIYHLGEEDGVHFYAMKFIDGDNLDNLFLSLQSAVEESGRSTQPADSTKRKTPHQNASTHGSGWSKGDTLASQSVIDRVSRDGSTGDPQFVRQFAKMGIQIAMALHHIHQNGVVHRDIKPANLLMDTEGDVWLSDFGLAMIRDNPALTQPGALIGTYRYMSPEQAMGSKRVIVDHRTDIYSLGLTLYELLTLRRAFYGGSREEILQDVQFQDPPSVRKLSPRVPVDLETIVMKAIAKNPNARFQSAAELANELQRFQEGKPLTIRPPTVLEKFGYWARTHRQTVATLAISLTTIFVAAIVTAFVQVQAKGAIQASLDQQIEQTKEVERQLNISEGLRLAANSLLVAKKDEALGLLLAIEGATRWKSADVNDALMSSLNHLHIAKILVGHESPAGHLAFSPDSSTLISSAKFAMDSETKEPAIVWDVEDGSKRRLETSGASITSSAFGPKGKRILTTSSPPRSLATNDVDESMTAAAPQLWSVDLENLHTFQDAFLFKAHASAFSTNGSRVVLPTLGNTATIFQCIDGSESKKLTGHTARVVYAAFHPTEEQVLTIADDNTIRIWNAKSGETIHELDFWDPPNSSQLSESIQWTKFSDNGQVLVTGTRKAGIELWDLTDKPRRINQQSIEYGNAVFLNHGDLVLTHGLPTATAMIRHSYDAEDYQEIRLPDTMPMRVAVSPDSRYAGIIHTRDLRTLILWDFQSRAITKTLNTKSIINDVVFSPDSKFVATASKDERVRLWHVESGTERSTFPTTVTAGVPVAVSPDGKSLAIAAGNEVSSTAICRFDQAPRTVSLDGRMTLPSHGGERMLLSSGNRLAIHRMEDGSFLEQETYLRADAFDLAINRDGDRVAASFQDETIVLWMLGENERRLPLHPGSLARRLVFNPQGTKLFAACDNGWVYSWDAKTGAPEKAIELKGLLLDMDFNRDGTRLVVSAMRYPVQLLDADTLEVLHELSSEGTWFTQAKFTSDGKRVATFAAVRGPALQVWNVESGEVEYEFEDEYQAQIALHPTEPELLVLAPDKTLIWRYEDDEEIDVINEAMAGGVYSNDGQYFHLSTKLPAMYATNGIERVQEDFDQPQIVRWKREGLEEIDRIPFTTGSLQGLRTGPQDQVFAHVIQRDRIIIHDVVSREPTATIAGHYAPISHCWFTADSTRVMTTSWDGRVSTWDAQTGDLQNTRVEQQTPILAAAISNNQKLATGGRDGTCLVRDLANGTVSTLEDVIDSPIRHVAFHPSVDQLLVLTNDGQMYLFDHQTTKRLDVKLEFETFIWAEFSPDGQSLLVVPFPMQDDESSVVIMRDGAVFKTIPFPASVVSSHFHPNSKQILTATSDGIVSLTDIDTGATIQEFSHPAGSVLSAVIDKPGEFIYVTGREMGTVWKVDGTRWMTVEDLSTKPSLLPTWNPFLPGKPRYLLTRRRDKWMYRLWPLDPEQAGKTQVPRELTAEERKRYLLEEADQPAL